jgi:O-antigen/teichoic acid export membrane protein
VPIKKEIKLFKGQYITSQINLMQNMVWNLSGIILPLILAVFTIPKFIAGLGTDRFGLLTIIWMAIGYFSLFDFGFGRALTKLVAERLGTKEEREIPNILLTTIVLTGILGLLAAISVSFCAPLVVTSVLNIPRELYSEALIAFRIMACTLPFVIISAALIGFLEAMQRFKFIALVRTATGVVNFVGPIIAMYWSKSLVGATLALAVSRFLGFGVHFIYAWWIKSANNVRWRIQLKYLRDLLSFGSWITLTNVISPMMVYMDRIVIGAVLTMSAVAYYTTPYEVISRLSVFPVAMIGVLFPTFSYLIHHDEKKTSSVFYNSVLTVELVMIIPITVIILFAPEILTLWLGNDFALKSTIVMRYLAIGIFVNSLARFPLALIQSAGRPDWTAKLHLIELPIYFSLLYYLLKEIGIDGAAAAWSFRVTLDAVLLFLSAAKLVPSVRSVSIRILVSSSMMAIALIILMWVDDLPAKVSIMATVFVFSITLLYKKIETYKQHMIFQPAE